MRVFLDTNVLASAIATRGLCADVLREVFASHQLLISHEVCDELGRVLVEKFGVTSDLSERYLELLRRDAAIVSPSPGFAADLRDEDDIPIVGAAVHGNADVLVTGDKELQLLGRADEMRILSPREFWELLAS